MRKRPRQARSRATNEVILQAAAHVLGKRGWKGLTTNAVADTAGVSIGSIYQYYPNKLALIDDVRRRHFDEIRAILRAAADPGKPRHERIEILVDGMIAVHGRHPAAHRVLLEEAPRGEASMPDHQAFEADYLNAYEAMVASAMPDCAVTDRHVVAQILSAALAGATHDAAHRGTLGTARLRAELIKLVSQYLDA
jgi:AcrR family transcriptional regulator